MFTTPCFIRKNTPELREKLDELGYVPVLTTLTEDSILTFRSGFFSTHNLSNFPYPDKLNGIDCGDNEDLFLAIAALRDDSDYMQWFTSHEPEPNDRSMFLCKSENVKDYIHNYMDGWDTEGMTKATVEELVEHFKEKE